MSSIISSGRCKGSLSPTSSPVEALEEDDLEGAVLDELEGVLLNANVFFGIGKLFPSCK